MFLNYLSHNHSNLSDLDISVKLEGLYRIYLETSEMEVVVIQQRLKQICKECGIHLPEFLICEQLC